MKLTLVGTGIKLPHVDESALRYNLANAHLQAYLEAGELPTAGLRVERIDLPVSLDAPAFDDDALERVVATRPDVLGLSCYSWDIAALLELAARVHRALPSTRIVLGGPSATFQASSLLESHPYVSAVVRGEGEQTLALLLATGANAPAGVRGVTWRDDAGQVHAEPDRPVMSDLGQLASPLLQGTLTPPPQNLMLEFSRGCVYRCTYCAWKTQGAGVRYVSAERVRREIAWAHERRYEHAFIIDSAINNHDERLAVIADAVVDADPHGDMAFSYFVNHAFVTKGQMANLARIRAHEITIGLESVNPAALRAAGRKPLDTTQFASALDLLAEAGPVTVSLMLGMPGDDLDGFRRTLDFVARQAERPGLNRIRSARVHWMLVAPGSHLHSHAERHGLQLAPSGIPYVLGSSTFPKGDLVRALHVLHEHPRSDLFIWEDAEPLRMMGEPLPQMFAAGGDHIGGRATGRVSERDVLRAIRPLEPGRALRRGWSVGPIEHQQGWPVVVLLGPGQRRISVQLRARNAEPKPYARTSRFDLVWLASVLPGADRLEEQRLVAALADLVKRNDEP